MTTSSSLRKLPTQARAEQKVRAVLDAADRLLAAEGASALGTKRLAQDAGVSVGTVYNWFADKQAIAEALALRYWQELSDLVAGVAESAEAGAVEDPLGETVDVLAAGFRARPGFLALWFGGLRTERLRDVTRPQRVAVGASVTRILAAVYPHSSVEQRQTVARMLVLIGDGILREAFRVDRDGDRMILHEGKAALQAYIDARLAVSLNTELRDDVI
jgi:AcrR family transcriptional regulator